jgi:hypothetical protein
MLAQAANGFGALALSSLWSERALAGSIAADSSRPARQAPPGRGLHHNARAKRVVFLFMDGGPSQIDTFDPKPRLNTLHGKPMPIKTEPTQFNNVGTVLKCPWRFEHHGQSCIPVSSLFPYVAKHVDKLAIIRSMVAEFSEHTTANYFLHTGSGLQGRPSQGAWLNYGLGSESDDLPGFVVLNSGLIPPGGVDCFGSGFLPATFQGSVFKGDAHPIPNLTQSRSDTASLGRKRALLEILDANSLARTGADDAIESAIANQELAFRMQSTVPGLVDLAGETRATKALYGLDSDYEPARLFGRQCMIARRLLERGVRFIEVLCPQVASADRWDQHSDLKGGHERNARAVDQAIAGLLHDLDARGLLEDTIVLWGGEFGRTPMAQGSDGRDHNPFGFTMWLAGGGIRGGTIHGATDEFGYHAIENKVEVYDLHATMLHLLGIDHTRLTFRFGGRDMRLTDVHGRVVPEILA